MHSSDCVYYTAIIGRTDAAVEPPTTGYPCVAFCDDAATLVAFAERGWIALPAIETGLPPRRAARWYKTHGPTLFPHAKRLVWMDASLVPRQDLVIFASWTLTAELAAFPHPHVKNIAGEVACVKHLGFDRSQLPPEQYTRFLEDGYPDNRPHFETGVLIYDVTPETRKFFNIWWREIERGSNRDQISFPYALWKAGVQCHPISPGVIHFGPENPYVWYRDHVRRNQTHEPVSYPRLRRVPFLAVRVLGNEILPRDSAGSRLEGLRYLLYREKPNDVEEFYLINSVHDPDLRRAYRSLLREAKACWGELPPNPVDLRRARTHSERLVAAIRVNQARNLAIDYGRLRAETTLVLDGDVYLTPEQWSDFRDGAAKHTQPCLSLPCQRVDGSGNLIAAASESMLAFRSGSTWRFNEQLGFGENEKNELLVRLGHEPSNTTRLLHDEHCASVSLCNHVTLGELDADADLRVRIQLREQSINRLLHHLSATDDITAREACVVIVTHKHHALARAAALEAFRTGVKAIVVDNSGDYPAIAQEEVYRPGSNLGWVGGFNAGLARALEDEGCAYIVTMHNDVALSPGFFKDLLESVQDVREGTVGVIGPVSNWEALNELSLYTDAHYYVRVPDTLPRPVTTGAVMLLSRQVAVAFSGLDPVFNECVWGADLDLQKRVRDAGLQNYVTRRCFALHYQSANTFWDGIRGAAFENMQWARAAKARDIFRSRYGKAWPEQLHYGYKLSR